MNRRNVHNSYVRSRPVATIATNCAKIAFLTKADGRRYIKKFRGNDRFTAKHVYQCPRCGYFHITSQPQRCKPETDDEQEAA